MFVVGECLPMWHVGIPLYLLLTQLVDHGGVDLSRMASMTSSDSRSEERRQVCVHAFASDLNNTFDIKCIIRDISSSGCMIVTSQVKALPEVILIVPEHFKHPLIGKIVWRNDKFAGVAFLSSTGDLNLVRMQKYYLENTWNCEEGDEPTLLDGMVRPLSYADRLAKYNPRIK